MTFLLWGIRSQGERHSRGKKQFLLSIGMVFGLERNALKQGEQCAGKEKVHAQGQEVLKLRFELGLGRRQIARSCGRG